MDVILSTPLLYHISCGYRSSSHSNTIHECFHECPNEWLIVREFVASFADCHSYMSLRAERSECEAIPKGDGVSSCNGGLPRRILFASGTRRSPPAGGGAPTEREWAVGSFLQCIDLRLSRIPEGASATHPSMQLLSRIGCRKSFIAYFLVLQSISQEV
jgi:hypothetical protein